MIGNNIILDGVKWHVTQPHFTYAKPLCPKHYLGLSLDYNGTSQCLLKCAECETPYRIPRGYDKERQYVVDKIVASDYKKMKFINLDDEAIPLAERKIHNDNDKYFITALLTKSKVGKRLVLYAGENGSENKTQIFVEPEIKRLAFDQNNLHPTDVFLGVSAEFNDGTKSSIEKNRHENQ